MSLRLQLLGYLTKKQVFINGGELERFAETQFKKGSNASRRMRELHNDKLVERKIENGSVWYRARTSPEAKNAPVERVTPQDRLFDLSTLKPQYKGHL